MFFGGKLGEHHDNISLFLRHFYAHFGTNEMKRFLFLVTFFLAASAYSGEPLEKRIVGTWAQTRGVDRIALRFFASHDGLLFTPVAPIEFTWQAKGDNVEITITGDDGNKHTLEIRPGKEPHEIQWSLDPKKDEWEVLERVKPEEPKVGR